MKKTNSTSLNASILGIGIPMFGSMIVSQVQQITDQAFLGNAASGYLSAVGNASTTIWTTLSFLFALGTGSTILVSQKIGEGDKEGAEKVLGSTFVFSSVIAFILFVGWSLANESIYRFMGLTEPILGYATLYTRIYIFGVLLSGIGTASNAVFAGTGRTKPLFIASILRALINVVLDWVLIFGHLGFPAMGIAGAAIATLTADIIGGSFALCAAFSKTLPIRLTRRAIRGASLKTYASVVKIGIPASLEEFAWNTGNLLLFRFLNEINSLAAGVFTILKSVTLLPAIFFIAMGNASMTLSGQYTGKKEPHMIRSVINRSLLFTWIVSAVFIILFAFIPETFIRIFTKDQAVIAQAAPILLISALALLPRAGNLVFGGGIRGTGDTRWMLLTQLAGTALVLIFARTFMFYFGLGILGAELAVTLDETIRGIANGRKFYSGAGKKVSG